jgi:HAD superfamily hydrolase (TIGR01509 family)
VATPPAGLKAVIFDLDGVILDSRRANQEFYNHLLAQVGLPPMEPASVEVVHRESMEGSLRHLMGEGEHYRRALDYWRVMDPGPFIRLLELFPRVPETLQALRSRFRLAVATNRSKTTPLVLGHFGLAESFDLVVTPIEAGVPKPDPRVMAHTLEGLGLGREEVVYVGDSSVDESLARAAGVRLIAFRNPGLAAWAHVGEMAELPPLLGV